MGYKNDKNCDKVYDVSEVLEVFGKFQIVQYSLICLCTVFITMIDINYVFVAGNVNYRCKVPQCEDVNSTAEFPAWWPGTQDSCTRPILRPDFSGVCTNSSFLNQVEECTEWIYENNNTVVAELNLACQPWKINLIGAIHNIGMLASMSIAGWLTDRFGRMPTLVICVVGSCVGQLKTLATSWHMYVTIEFLEATMSGGSYTAAMVLMLEICGHNTRILSGVLYAYFIYFGESMFACIAMFVPYWKSIVRIIYTPCIVFICYAFLVIESPRWQIIKGKTEKAKKTMLLVAKMNNIKINTEELENMDGACLKNKFNIQEHEIKENILTVITSKEILKRLLVAFVCRFTASFVYYGLMVNSVWLPGDKYVNFLLATVMSFPGELISLYLMNKIGRKLPLIVGFILSGVFCIVSGYVSDSHIWAKISLFLLGKMVISACFTGAITYTMELYPTSARGSLLGLTSFASRMGAMLAPLTPMLNIYSEALPSIFFGASALISGVLVILTPETKDLPLMDTVQQVEDSVRKKEKGKTIGSENGA